MRLETNRLVIREFVPEDWESVHRYASDPKVTRYTLWGPNTEEETKDYVAGMKAMQQKEPRTHYEWAVIRKTDGELIGGCGINISGSNGEIGYCFHADHWGQGYASECAKAMLEFGFRQLGLHRIYATCRPENIGSERVMQKIGMQKEGYLREHMPTNKGGFANSWLYSILSHEYVPES
ncbi:GCN5 family acetyltransferase [Paenibacillus sp. SSG-1]|uniref:GNAT family N-acetyltransferase n=1 Tax=Paenibacillus sp. SSG-1 TaxID=1443669 RepID=UPI000B7E8113|nr:GNAT family N-acetyltransferase [Paenibacillus sp. SSG-1]OXL85258.1 GCN5 family acetyltransferase [Paenibacillus sp. SSG-1]